MMEIRDLLLKIIDETAILQSALEVEDIDLVESALERRKLLILKLEDENFDGQDQTLMDLYKRFKELDQACLQSFENMEAGLKEAYHSHRMEKQKTEKKKKAMQGYHQVSAYDSAGDKIDGKK